jgi:hypothetical protein
MGVRQPLYQAVIAQLCELAGDALSAATFFCRVSGP